MIGSFLSAWAVRKYALDMHHAYLYVWIPIVVLGGVQETIAWIRKMNRESSPLFTRRFVKFMISFASLFIVFCIALYFLVEPNHPVPGLILLFVAAIFSLYGQLTYSSLYIEACLTLLTAVLLVLLGVRSTEGFTFIAAFTAVMFVVAGIHTTFMDRRHAG